MPPSCSAWCSSSVSTLANPDALIAERNVDRFQAQGKIDVAYNGLLSADADSALSEASAGESTLIGCWPGSACGWRREGVRSWNLARERARRGAEHSTVLRKAEERRPPGHRSSASTPPGVTR